MWYIYGQSGRVGPHFTFKICINKASLHVGAWISNCACACVYIVRMYFIVCKRNTFFFTFIDIFIPTSKDGSSRNVKFEVWVNKVIGRKIITRTWVCRKSQLIVFQKYFIYFRKESSKKVIHIYMNHQKMTKERKL